MGQCADWPILRHTSLTEGVLHTNRQGASSAAFGLESSFFVRIALAGNDRLEPPTLRIMLDSE